MILGFLLLLQAAQNPSPMVEHTRAHTRLAQRESPGQRHKLELGTLFVPEKLKGRKRVPLLLFFHGGAWLPEAAAAGRGMAAITAQIGSGSGAYAKPFADRQLLGRMLAQAQKAAGMSFSVVYAGGWSAGCGSIRELLKSAARLDGILLIDGIHASYADGKPGPLESKLDPGNLDVWLPYAREAMAGKKRMIVTHSEIFPGTFASTTETTDYLLSKLGLKCKAVLQWGPMGTQQLSEAKAGRFLLMGYAGNSAPDHVDQLHSLPEYLKLLLK